MSDDEGLDLTSTERQVIATRLAAQHLRANIDDWLLWEDVPSLGEFAFDRLNEAVIDVVNGLDQRVRSLENLYDIDSQALLERLR